MGWILLFVTIAFWALGEILRPKPDVENARASKLGDLRFPRATAGSPVPVIFGKVRLRSPNTTWFGNFKAVAEKVKVKTSIFSSKDQIVGYNYFVSMDLALCTGPDVTLHKIWAEKKVLSDQTATPVNGDGVTRSILNAGLFGGPQKGGGMAGTIRFYSGAFTQSRNAFISGLATNGADLPAYVGICHVVFENWVRTITVPYIGQVTITTPFFIGTQAQLHALSFELSRYPDNLGLGANRLIGDDLNPAEIIYSILTEAWGGLGVNPASIDKASFVAVGTTLKAESNGASVTIASSNDAKSVLQEMLRQVDGLLYQDPATGRIVLRLVREDYTIGTLPVFDETNVESVETFSRSSWADTYNQIRLIYNSRAKRYNDFATFVQDGANISAQGQVRPIDLNFPTVTVESLATTLATRELAYRSVPLFRVTLRATRFASTLRPGDPFVFAWARYGIVQSVMRVQRFDFGELISGNVVMDCIQDKFAVASTVYAVPTGGLDNPGDNPALDITKWNVFESPYLFVNRLATPFAVTVDSSYFWALARDPSSTHDGYDFLTSLDNFVEEIITELSRVDFPYNCLLFTAVHRTQAQDDGVLAKIVVQSPQPDGNVFGVQSASEIRTDGRGLVVVNGEVMAYESRTDNGNGTYDLNTVHRALLDTTFGDHAVGDAVFLLSGVTWLSLNANADLGTLFYQLLSFTAQQAQVVGDFATQSFARAQRYDRPLPPDLMQVEGLRAPIEVIGVTDVDITTYVERNRTSPDEVVLLADSADTPEASTTYTARLYLDGVLLATSTALTFAGLPHNLAGLSGTGLARVEIEAVRAVGASHTPDWAEFFYALYLSLSAERLTNSGFESSLATGWTVTSGTWDNPVTAYPLDAVRVVGASGDDQNLESLTGTPAELRQNYTIPGGDLGKSAIFRIWKGGKGSAVGQIIIELRAGAVVLKSITTPNVAAATVGKWELLEIPLTLRSDAATVRVRIMATGAGSVWDNASLKNHTTSPPPAITYDGLTTPVGCWSLRRAISGYGGALVRIRDTFDDSEQDVGFDLDGNLDAFFVRGQARVVRIYDQSGNAVNLEAPSAATQPRLLWNMTETGRSIIVFDNLDDQLRDPTPGTARPYMALRPNAVFVSGPKKDTASDYLFSIAHSDGAHSSPFTRWGMDADTDWGIWLNGAVTNDAGATAPNGGKSVWWLDYQNGLGYHNDDAVSTVTWTAADVTYPNSTRLKISGAGDDSLPWSGSFSELCIFTGNIAAGDRQLIMEDAALYWYNLAI